MIYFNKPWITKKEEEYVLDCLKNSKLSGDGKYTKKVQQQFKDRFGIDRMLLTTSGTDALELAFVTAGIGYGDEVITPSFTFSSTVNAFMLSGAKPIFCDIKQDTMNIDERLIEGLISSKTKAIIVVDYAGFPCEMDEIMSIAKKHNLIVIEDAAQSVGSTYKGRQCGTLADFGCFSFHETKNYCMGEGGATVFNSDKDLHHAEIIREKGTNRNQVLKGLVDKYTWHEIGSSFLPSDLLAAMLAAQMDRYDEIFERRMNIWNCYYKELKELEEEGRLRLPVIPKDVTHNAHMFNIQLESTEDRDKVIDGLKEKDIISYICYVPLHSAPMGIKLGYKAEDCPVTEDIGQRTLRLPLYAEMTTDDALKVTNELKRILR